MKDYVSMLEKLKTEARENFIPIVRDKTLQAAVDLINSEKYNNILEIGTAVGYSGINMLISSNAFLTTIEKDEQRLIQAKCNFENFDLSSRVKPILGDALDVLNLLKSENCKYDFVFLDGPKGQYIKYLPIIKSLLNKGGILFADNVLLGGLINNKKIITHKNRSMAVNMQKFIDSVNQDYDFETKIYEIEDGYIVCKLKNSAE